mmetsp:Transcript_11194/g.41910  ORF Transcript_11194/g.41910 Transcript_11194/m.41910 type:complete len:87 (-) Transcript_11194:136-396(-)
MHIISKLPQFTPAVPPLPFDSLREAQTGADREDDDLTLSASKQSKLKLALCNLENNRSGISMIFGEELSSVGGLLLFVDDIGQICW